MTAKVITDPGELADLIEGADRLMIRLGGENSFHKLPEPEAAMIVSALRKLCGEADQRDAARYRWLIKCSSFGKADNAGENWMHLKGYHHAAVASELGWIVTKPQIDAHLDAAMSSRSDTEESK